MNVAARRAANDKPDRSTHLQRRDANAASYARFQRLGGNLRAAQYDDSVDRFKGNPLTAIGVRHQQRTAPMRHSGAMITNIHGAQVAHRNTTSSIYLVTLWGALASPGRQCCWS